MAENRPAPDSGDGHVPGDGHSPGLRQVLLVGLVVVAVVLGLAIATSVLPTSAQDIVFRTPLAIVVLLVGTVGLLLWVARRPTPRV